MLRKVVLILGFVSLCGGVALAVTYMYDDLAVVGPGGANPARIYIQQYDPLFGVPWTALKDSGLVPAELEIAPVPGQYDQATVKTQLAILGVGQYTPGDEEATPPFDARLLMSGPWPYSYVALRDDGSSPLEGQATATSGLTRGGYFVSDSTSGRGVVGYATATSGTTFGGSFETSSTEGQAVRGHAKATTGTTYAGRFVNDSTSGHGVYGLGGDNGVYGFGGNNGVYGRSDSTSGVGVYGYTASATGTTYGVYGQSDSTDGFGVYGDGGGVGGAFTTSSTSGTGAYGYASASTGTTYGVYGEVSSADGYAGYFTGGKGVYADDIEWAPKTGYIMVHANEYVPAQPTYSYVREVFSVRCLGGTQLWFAPLQLPHGSTITYIEWYYADSHATDDITFSLVEVDGSSIVNLMASANSSGSAGWGSVSTTSITSPTIDNTAYSYVVYGRAQSTGHRLCQVKIHYTYSEPY